MTELRRIRMSAVFLGGILDEVAFVALPAAPSSMVPTDVTAFSIAALFGGTDCTTVGAYVAAARAQAALVTHGILVTAVGFAISFAR